jgi:hypothetical protein
MHKIYLLTLLLALLLACDNGNQRDSGASDSIENQNSESSGNGDVSIEELPIDLPTVGTLPDPKILGSWVGTYGYFREFPFSDPDIPEADKDAVATSLIISSNEGQTHFCLAATQWSVGEDCSFDGTVSVLSETEAVLYYKDIDDAPLQAVIKKSGNVISLDQVNFDCGAIIHISDKVTRTKNQNCEDAPDFLWKDNQ